MPPKTKYSFFTSPASRPKKKVASQAINSPFEIDQPPTSRNRKVALGLLWVQVEAEVPILGAVPSVELEPGEPPVEAQLLQRWPAHVRGQPLRRENRFYKKRGLCNTRLLQGRRSSTF